VCTALQLGGDVEQSWLMSKYDVIYKTGSTLHSTTPTEEERATAIGNTNTKIWVKIGGVLSEDMIVDRQTHRHRHTHTHTGTQADSMPVLLLLLLL